MALRFRYALATVLGTFADRLIGIPPAARLHADVWTDGTY